MAAKTIWKPELLRFVSEQSLAEQGPRAAAQQGPEMQRDFRHAGPTDDRLPLVVSVEQQQPSH